MTAVKIICWEDDGAWLGYLPDFPDYKTQGESLDDLKENLARHIVQMLGNDGE